MGLRLFIAAWRAEKARADEAEARATQAEQRIADYQDAVCQRDEIIAENKARLTQVEERRLLTDSEAERRDDARIARAIWRGLKPLVIARSLYPSPTSAIVQRIVDVLRRAEARNP